MKKKYDTRREVLNVMDFGLTMTNHMRDSKDYDVGRLEVTRENYVEARDAAIAMGIDVSGYPKTLRMRTYKQANRHFDYMLGILII